MRIPFLKPRPFFPPDQQREIVQSIGAAETQTSGEIRLYVESRCRYVNPLDRAAEVFHLLKMENTQARNAVLLYVAIKDRQLAIYGDKGIHEKVGDQFWNEQVNTMLSHFNKKDYVKGLVTIIKDIGQALKNHFPYDKDTDKNELPDDIVFGK